MVQKWTVDKNNTDHQSYIIIFNLLFSNFRYKLDMSTARRRLKSPQSLYGTSTHPTMVTHRSQSWSWMIHSRPFLSMSISAPTPIFQIRLFKTLTCKLQGQGHGCGRRTRPYSQPSINWFAFFLFHINQITIPQIRLFWNLTLKNQWPRSWVISKVKVILVQQISNRCTSFSFHINWTNHSWDMSNRVFDLEKTHPKFSKKIWQKRITNIIPLKSNQVMTMTREI